MTVRLFWRWLSVNCGRQKARSGNSMRIGRFAAALAVSAAASSAFVPAASAAPAPAASAARISHALIAAPGLSEKAHAQLSSGGASVCYEAYIQNTGWQPMVCDGAVAGTTGQSLRMEALSIVTFGTRGICANAHVQNIGWQGQVCASDGSILTVGTTGQSLRMEALTLQPGIGQVCANAHVQNIGWQGMVCGSEVTVGTTGQSLRMEAIQITVTGRRDRQAPADRSSTSAGTRH